MKPASGFFNDKIPVEMAELGGAERKVMVAIDESESSYYALMWALNNLKDSIGKSRLIIFMAQPAPKYHYTYAAALGSAGMYCPLSASHELVNIVQENDKKLTLALLERAKEICASNGVSAETISEIGDPKVAICNAVQMHNISMLVLGEHGLGKIERAFIGSVSNYCIHNAKCPVLVVKKP